MSRYIRPQVGSDMYKVAAGFALALAFLCVASINIADSHLLHQQQSNSAAVAETNDDNLSAHLTVSSSKTSSVVSTPNTDTSSSQKHTADTSTDQILDEHSCISDEATEQSEA